MEIGRCLLSLTNKVASDTEFLYSSGYEVVDMVRAVRQPQVVPVLNRDELLVAEIDHTIDRMQEAERASESATATLEELYRVAAEANRR